MKDRGSRKERLGSYVQYTDGEVVFAGGSSGKQIYFITNGEAEVSQQIGEKKRVMAVLVKGDFFGEMASLSNDVRSMTVTAVGNLHLYELSMDEMFQYMRNNTEIMRDVYASLVKRLQDTNLQVKELMLKISADGKEVPQVGVISQLRKEIVEKDRQIGKLQKQLEQSQKRTLPWRRRER